MCTFEKHDFFFNLMCSCELQMNWGTEGGIVEVEFDHVHKV